MNTPALAGQPDSGASLPPSARPANLPPSFPTPKSGLAGFAICLLVGVILYAGYFFQEGWSLPAIALGLGLILVVLGTAIMNRPLGALINAQNVMSLARFQMALWTIVVLASYLSYALVRIRLHAAAALDFRIDPMLLTLMGMSAASFIGAPFILGTKRDKEPDPMSTAKTAAKSDESPDEIDDNREGTLYANGNIADARITDMFQGDEVGNTMQIDLAKVQMFFFTIISAIAYLVLVFKQLRHPGEHAANLDLGLPAISGGLVTAVGISHASYLSSKGLDHTPVQK